MERVVVGAAVVRDGRVLAARRTYPIELAGRWEFPGGKVEPDEDAGTALVRELREELRVEIQVDAWLTTEQAIADGYVLRVALATLVDGEPEPTEHDELRWLSGDELDDVPWLAGNRPFLAELSDHLPRLAE